MDTAVNPSILLEYENLVLDWIATIENILTDGLEERYQNTIIFYCWDWMTFSAVLIFLFFSVILGNGDHD